VDDFDLGAFDNMDFDAVAKTVEASQAEKEKVEAEAAEMELLRENSDICGSGSCAI
jgi:hypothetical protein